MTHKTPDPLPTDGAVAWTYELANYINPDGSYTGWDRHPKLSFDKPEVPEGSIRNLRALVFAHPPKPRAVTDAMVDAALHAFSLGIAECMGFDPAEMEAKWQEGKSKPEFRYGLIAMRKALAASQSETAAPPIKLECASEGCGKPATVNFERGGVGSYYCHDCYMRIQSRPAKVQS